MLPVRWAGISALGLKVFFFLSGFLITRLLFAENKATGRISLGSFYLRRLVRLYPVILAYLLITAAVALGRGDRIDTMEVASVFLYFVNYRVINYLHTGGSFTLPVQMLWSLSIEEHFYLLAPCALVLLASRAKRMLIVALAICVVCMSLRLFYAYRQPDIVNSLEIYWRSETRFDSIAFGVILACLAEFPSGKRIVGWLAGRKAFLLGVILFALSFVDQDNYFKNTWRFTVQGIALLPIVAGVIFAQPLPWLNHILNTRLLAWVGGLSYSLYVWHGGIDFFFRAPIERLPLAFQPAAHVLIAFCLAVTSYYVLERPVMKVRRRLLKSRLDRGTREATA